MELTIINYDQDHMWALIIEQWKHHQFRQFSLSGIKSFCIEVPKGTKLTRSLNHLTIHLPEQISQPRTYLITYEDNHFQVDHDLNHIYEYCAGVCYSSFSENGYAVMIERDTGDKSRWYKSWSKLVAGNGLSTIYFDHDVVINYNSRDL